MEHQEQGYNTNTKEVTIANAEDLKQHGMTMATNWKNEEIDTQQSNQGQAKAHLGKKEIEMPEQPKKRSRQQIHAKLIENTQIPFL